MAGPGYREEGMKTKRITQESNDDFTTTDQSQAKEEAKRRLYARTAETLRADISYAIRTCGHTAAWNVICDGPETIPLTGAEKAKMRDELRDYAVKIGFDRGVVRAQLQALGDGKEGIASPAAIQHGLRRL